MTKLRIFLVALLFVGIAGCASNPADQSSQYGAGADGMGDESELLMGSENDGMSTSQMGMEEGGQYGGADSMSLDDPNSMLAQRIFYFAFDSSEVRSEYVPVLEAHAQYLLNHPSAHVRLEGHTDERGTSAYNLALGERRAKSVAQILMLKGVSSDQVTTVSYGEEKPVELGHAEQAWAQNRRVEMVYTSR